MKKKPSKKTAHGGRREGAGRKAEGEARIKASHTMPRDLDDWLRKNCITESRSDLFEKLLREHIAKINSQPKQSKGALLAKAISAAYDEIS